MKALAPLLLVSLLAAGILRSSAAERPVGTSPDFKGPVGLQLYSLRAEFTRYGVPPTLKQVTDYGFKIVETAGTYNLPVDQFRKLIDAAGLKVVSAHFPYDRFKNDLDGVIADAKALGVEYAGCASIPGRETFNEEAARAAIVVFNRAGEALQKHGLKFFYHPHGFEFQPYGAGTLLDLIIQETRPEWVAFEMDTYWVVHPGHDPVKLLNKYGARWQLMHVKDKRKGVPGDHTGRTDVRHNVPVGTGQMDWPAILQAAQKAGVKYYFLEDESPVVNDQIKPSLRYLETVRW